MDNFVDKKILEINFIVIQTTVLQLQEIKSSWEKIKFYKLFAGNVFCNQGLKNDWFFPLYFLYLKYFNTGKSRTYSDRFVADFGEEKIKFNLLE